MTPAQQRLIDAAAKVHYERLNVWADVNGFKWTPWEDLTQGVRERHYAAVIGPVTVALRAAVNVAAGTASYDDAVQKSAGCNTTGQSIANTISSLIPAQEKKNEA